MDIPRQPPCPPQPVRVRPPRAGGFTLIELVTAMIIAAILATLALPSFSGLIASQRAKSAATDVYVALIKARSEATKRNANVTLAPAGGWQSGWAITASGVTLDNHGALNNSVAIGGPANVVYQSSGRLQSAAAPSFNITATAGLSSASRCVTVDLSGRPYVKASSC